MRKQPQAEASCHVQKFALEVLYIFIFEFLEATLNDSTLSNAGMPLMANFNHKKLYVFKHRYAKFDADERPCNK